MATINTNMAANIASNAMTRNERSMSATMERLSTGLRINSAKDDAAGLAISSKMTSQIRGLNQAVRNANDAISMIQVGEGALKEATNMLQRMRELAIQASSDSNTTNDRTALNNEFTQLRDELSRVNANTQWNGTAIFSQNATSSASKTFQIGANASQTVGVTFQNFDAGTTTGTVAAKTGSAFFALDTDGGTSGDAIAVHTYTFGADKTKAEAAIADAGTGDGFSISDGTTTITIADFDKSHSSGTAAPTTVADLVSVIQGLSGYSDLSFAVTEASGNNGIVLTQKAAGVVDAPVVTTASSGGITFTTTAQAIKSGVTDASYAVSTAGAGAKNIEDLAITSQSGSNEAMYAMSDAIDKVNSQRALLGASMSRLEYASDNLQNVAQNTAAARSRVLDADYASETTELARTQIIQQAATAMLAQANQSQQSVLALLRS
tara:strand:+ start:5650 stop:6960 length:1311 start_codon:yes stop_codon:yes gene_type:complete